MTEITEGSRIYVTGGTGMMSREEFAAMLRVTLACTTVFTSGPNVVEPRPRMTVETPTEIETWNAAVEAKKQAKLAAKGKA